MIFIISPAKALDYTTPSPILDYSQPDFLDDAQRLIDILRARTPAEVADLMHLSDKLAALNVARYASWSQPFTPSNAKQAVFAFNGDVYGGLDASSLSRQDILWVQSHLRILSGLYGILRPLDLMQPYRLEMGTRLPNPRGEHLYAFWVDRLTQKLNNLLKEEEKAILVNLASEEYFKAIKVSQLQAQLITPVFEDWKGGRYKIISFYAKRARGLMVRYAALNRINKVEALKGFDYEGYVFCEDASNDQSWVFRRKPD